MVTRPVFAVRASPQPRLPRSLPSTHTHAQPQPALPPSPMLVPTEASLASLQGCQPSATRHRSQPLHRCDPRRWTAASCLPCLRRILATTTPRSWPRRPCTAAPTTTTARGALLTTVANGDLASAQHYRRHGHRPAPLPWWPAPFGAQRMRNAVMPRRSGHAAFFPAHSTRPDRPARRRWRLNSPAPWRCWHGGRVGPLEATRAPPSLTTAMAQRWPWARPWPWPGVAGVARGGPEGSPPPVAATATATTATSRQWRRRVASEAAEAVAAAGGPGRLRSQPHTAMQLACPSQCQNPRRSACTTRSLGRGRCLACRTSSGSLPRLHGRNTA